MRILAVSDLYPPLALGGYEVAAAEVVTALRARGHEVHVLATDVRADEAPEEEAGVARRLRSRLTNHRRRGELIRQAWWERLDERVARDVLRRVRPDVVFVWNVGGVSHRSLALLMNGATPSVVFVFGDWPLRKYKAPHQLDYFTSFFAPRSESGARRLARAMLSLAPRLAGISTRAEPLRFDHFQFGSRFMQERFHEGGLHARVSERLIHYGLFGVFAEAAREPPPPASPGHELRLLFVGRLWEAKGAHTVIEALPVLRQSSCQVQLTVVGPREHPDYAERLEQRARELGVASEVRFAGPIPREGLLEVYRAHDVLVFPSLYDEPFGIVQLEAMAAGCVVVGTGTGGSAEILDPEHNALLFRPGDARALAEQLTRLVTTPGLATKLREGGKETVRSRFLNQRMVDEIEDHLLDITIRSR